MPPFIFVITDRFYNGNTANDSSYGRSLDGSSEIGTFHGGDLAGLTYQLNQGYFTNLGVNAIWITCPFEQVHSWVAGGSSGDFKHYAYHGYYIQDFTMIDKNMGTTNELRTFIDTAHSQGIRVIFDIIMNHCGYNTMYDMRDYSFGELYSGWESCTSYNYHNYINYNSGNWVNWWGADWIRAGFPGYTSGGSDDYTQCVGYLPDFKTESTTYVGLPVFYSKKTDTSATYLANTTVRGYLVTWISEWVRLYGVDGFRCDTAKHVELASWAALKAACVSALDTWKANNPTKKLDDLDFWMTGECWGHGVGRSTYYDNGFDNMINFSFQSAVANGISSYSGIESTYSSYASSINNSNPAFNALSYISSHDTSLFYNGDNDRQKKVGALLLLCPGCVQIFYGDENARAFGATGSDAQQGTRSQMSFPGNSSVLAHWQKIGRFRNRHIAVGAGAHTQITSSPYTFSRTYSKDSIVDNVICVLGASGSTTVNVSSVFANGTQLRDYYSGATATVSGGTVTFTPTSDVILIEQVQ
jgi:alpha-amylase